MRGAIGADIDAVEVFRVPANGSEHLIIPIIIGGRQTRAVLDTGSSMTVVDASLTTLLGPSRGSITADTTSGAAALELYSAPKITIGRLEPKVAPTVFVAADFSGIRHAIKKDFYACAGMDVLKNFVLQLDLRGGTVRVFVDPPTRRGTTVPLRMTAGVPEIYVPTSGWPASAPFAGGLWFRIDTGSVCPTDGELKREYFELFQKHGVLAIIGTGAGHDLLRAATAPYGRLSATLTIGAQKRTSPAFFAGDENRLGLRPLAAQLITFDFPNGTAHFEQYSAPLGPNSETKQRVPDHTVPMRVKPNKRRARTHERTTQDNRETPINK